SAAFGQGEVQDAWRVWLGTWLLPRRLRTWERALEALSAAPACEGEPCIGGPLFYHSLLSQGRLEFVRWSGPTETLHCRQWELIRDYGRVRLVGWFLSWVTGRRSKGRRPARNIDHDTVIQALQADGWTITHDPLLIPYGDPRLIIDLCAEG